MKRSILILAVLLQTMAAKADVIFFPPHYTLVSYSAEFIFSYEKITHLKKTTSYWGGVGCVGSFFFAPYPAIGMEMAIERRRYFNSGQYKRFSISAYAGAALMWNRDSYFDAGIVPGFKLNYKAQLSEKTILEPYLGVSIPVSYNISHDFIWVPFPVLTIGVRFGISSLVQKKKI